MLHRSAMHPASKAFPVLTVAYTVAYIVEHYPATDEGLWVIVFHFPTVVLQEKYDTHPGQIGETL